HRDELLYNIYKMGKNAIQKGERDNWGLTPKFSAEITKLAQAAQPATPRTEEGGGAGEGRQRSTIPLKLYDSVLKKPAYRDARGYIVPANQPDFATATRFVNTLIASGMIVQKATADFTIGTKLYPVGSFVIATNQAFRPHILDMFEPQDHPNDFLYPGGPPIAPYDAAGWTLAYQMGVQFDKIIDAFTGPFERIAYGQLQPLKGTVATIGKPVGYLLNARANNAFAIANDLLKKGIDVFRTTDSVYNNFSKGSFFIPAVAKTKNEVEKAIIGFGVDAVTLAKKPLNLTKIAPARIALWDNYGGSMPSGWMRLILEQYHFAADIIYAKDIDTGNLKTKYDVIIFVGGAIPTLTTTGRAGLAGLGEPKADSIPEEYRNRLGKITATKSIPQLKQFLEDGGNIITIGSSTNLAYHLRLPVNNALTETVNGLERTLPGEKYYIPGSILKVSVDSTEQGAWGMPSQADVYFDASPVFNILPEGQAKGSIKPLAWFADGQSLRSGWAWGQSYLSGGVAAFKATVGKGTLYAFGPEITFRAQPYGTFKFLFNGLYK
ncbi:MAG: peptidase, partial [Deinococcales bacterium]|nr:peptidase [Chitinophagaceae bacterium]